MAKSPRSLKAFFGQYRIPMALGAVGFSLPLLPRLLSSSPSLAGLLLWALVCVLLAAPLGGFLGFWLAWGGRPVIAQITALLISITAGFFLLLLGLRVSSAVEAHWTIQWRSEFTILIAALILWGVFQAGFALIKVLRSKLLDLMEKERVSGRLAHLSDHQRLRPPRHIAKALTRHWLRFLAFFVVFISSCMAFFIPRFSALFFWFVLALSLAAALVAPSSFKPPAKPNAPLLLLWGGGALLAAAKALQPRFFASLYASLAAVLALTAGFVLLHFIFPRVTLWIRRELVTPQTKLGKGCLSVSLALIGGGGALGASLGRRLSQQIDDRNLSFALMGGCLLFVAFLLLHTGVAQYIYDRTQAKE